MSLSNKKNPCFSGVKCVNTAGSYYCHACPAGMMGNGEHCEDIDECAVNNGGCSREPFVKCTNKSPGYECGKCPDGYEGDGRYCRKASLCDFENGGCSALATCSSNGNSVSCKCMNGYTGIMIKIIQQENLIYPPAANVISN